MGGSLGQLTSRQLERLKSELAEVIIANFCYPAFLDYRLNILRTRPVDRRKRQEVWSYVNSLHFSPISSINPSSMDFRRFVERVFLRYVDLNRTLLASASARQVAAVRARVPQLAMSVARGLADYLVLSEASTFGQARLVESWASAREEFREPAWEQIEKSTQLLQTTLVYLRTAGAGGPQVDGAAQPDISDFPTRLLTPVDVEQRLTSAGMSNGANHYAAEDYRADNGVGNGAGAWADFPPMLSEEEAVARGQFKGPRRSPTASRPLDRPLVMPPAAPSEEAPITPKSSSSRPIQPSMNPPSRPIQPPPAPQPAPSAQPPAAADAWQALLMLGQSEQPPAASVNPPPAPSVQPEPDLLDLPESFEVPRSLDLPPDLAELYGDYLRDSRAASIDLAATPQEQHPAAAQHGSSALPRSETDEEVDALFTALTSRIAAQEQAERATGTYQNAGSSVPPNASPSETAPQQPCSAQSAAQEVSGASRGSAPLDGQREEAGPPAAPAKALADGDVMIFSQLQHQISTWLKMAAISYQIDLTGQDAVALVGELRRIAALEEAELQVLESLVALCYRVTSTKQATMEDYKQAMMLYLLHHRSRLAL
jgi:hypothetical protein